MVDLGEIMDDLIKEVLSFEEKHSLTGKGIQSVILLRLAKAVEQLAKELKRNNDQKYGDEK